MADANDPESVSGNAERDALTRRGFFGVAGGAAWLHGLTPEGARGRSVDGGNRADLEDVQPHDHSSETAGGATLRPERLATSTTPVVDVTAHGVVGDGEADDSAALQDAVDAATPHGVLHVPYDRRVRLEETVTVGLNDGRAPGEQNRFAFVCEGALTPAPGIGPAIEIVGGVAPYVFARVQGGGADVETDSAFHVKHNAAGHFEGWARDYAGRVFHFEESATYSVGHLKTANCGQSIAVFDASPMGEVRDVFDVSPTRAPEFHDSSDVCINQYENYMAEGVTERGIRFENCLSVWIDRVAVGGEADTPPAEFRSSKHMFVNALHLGGSPTWGGVIENVRYATFRIFCNVNQRGIKYTGGGTDGNRLLINGQNIAETGLLVTEDVYGYHFVTGNIVQTSSRAIDIRSTDAEIHLDHVYAYGNGGGDLSVPDENEVHTSNCRFLLVDGTPKTQNGIGVGSADREQPDERNWTIGDRVVFTDTGDASGNGLYELTPRGWSRVGDDPADRTDQSTTDDRSGQSTSGSERTTGDSPTATADAPGFEGAATLLALAAVVRHARQGDDE
jgi:hypothetical protein